MTVIAAVAREGRVVMAADDVMYAGGRVYPSPPKIRRVRCSGSSVDVLLAAAGAAELLTWWVKHHQVKAPGRDLQDWAQGLAEDITKAAAAMTPSCVVGGSSPDDRGALDGMLLLGHAGRLWTLDANMAVHVPDGVLAIGSGGELAHGVLLGALCYGAAPRDAVERAVTWSATLAEGCGLLGLGPLVEELAHE